MFQYCNKLTCGWPLKIIIRVTLGIFENVIFSERWTNKNTEYRIPI